ncbi:MULTISPECIES: hypothetical protein [Paenibacillus]|nr:hypothetical protein [Paenibacillus xylanexedens]MDP9698281.1 hypothetical protein [Paenibacillus intestini]
MTTVGLLGTIHNVGADHNYIFQDELRKEDVHWIYPLKLKENE